MSKYFFSIIIPHKNIPDLLQRCLDSIPKREDVQVIIVDDNSDPQKVDFEYFPGLGQKNTEVYFDKTGRGAGRARNVGLEHAKGEWILFADADDVFEPEFKHILSMLEEDSSSDLVNFEVTSRDLEDNRPNDEIEKINYHCNKKEYLENPQSFKYIVLTPWGKAIRHSLIKKHNIKFEEVKFGNDLLFATLCDFYCLQRRIIPLVGYCWMKRKDSLWRQKNLEWAKIRFAVLLNSGRIMRNLGDVQIANRYIDGANGFLDIIFQYSRKEYLLAMFRLGVVKRNFHILFRTIPRLILYFSKEKITHKIAQI